MTTSDAIADLFVEVAAGQFLLKDQVFENVDFREFTLIGLDGFRYRLENIVFRNCNVRQSPTIYGDVTLKDVVFEDFCRNKGLDLTAEVLFQGVKFIGRKKPKYLRIKPPNEMDDEFEIFLAKDSSLDSLDVSEYEGEVSIIGLAEGAVRIDPDKQARLQNGCDPGSVELHEHSIWFDAIRMINQSKFEELVASIPGATDPLHETFVRELHQLRATGAIPDF